MITRALLSSMELPLNDYEPLLFLWSSLSMITRELLSSMEHPLNDYMAAALLYGAPSQ